LTLVFQFVPAAVTCQRPAPCSAWIAAIGACLEDPAVCRLAGATARSHVQRHFGWDGVVDAYEALFTRFSGKTWRMADA